MLGLIWYFFINEKKNTFQVMLFSMLHYLISQSNDSVFTHEGTVSWLIVVAASFLHICWEGIYFLHPFAAFLWILLGAVTMVMGPYLIIFALPQKLKNQSGSLHPSVIRGWKMGGLCEWREACQLSQEVGFLQPRILRRNCRPAKSGEKYTDSSNWDLGLALCLLSVDLEQPPLWSPL